MARKHTSPATPDTAAPVADAGPRIVDSLGSSLAAARLPDDGLSVTGEMVKDPAVLARLESALAKTAPVAPAAAAKAPAPCAHTWERGRLADGSQVYRCAACDLTRAR